MQYTFVTGLHGNETMPLVALASIGVPQVVANEKALSVNKRFVDADLNKAFGADGNGYEYQRASELLKIIPQDKSVIDFHSFPTESRPFAIVVDREMIPLATKTGLPTIVMMEFNIKEGHALINHRKGISVEVGMHLGMESFKTTLEVYHNLMNDYVPTESPKIYTVYGVITDPGTYKNFELHQDGFYPVLAGDKAKNGIFGLKARLDA